MSHPWTSVNRQLCIAVLLAAIAVLPYANSLTADFTFDDLTVIRNNPAVQREPAQRLWNNVYLPGFLYRPLTMLTYAANARLSTGPFYYHVVNVALHASVTVASYGLARQLLASEAIAFAAAVLFAVHPCHTEAVTSIVGRAELLAAFFVVASLLAFCRALKAEGALRVFWWAISLGAMGAGLLAKESAFTTIALIPVLHWHRLRQAAIRQRVRVTLPYLAVGLAYLGLRLAVVGSMGLPTPPVALDNPLAHVAPTVRIATALVVLAQYASLFAIPLQLSADYSFNAIPLVLSPFDSRLLLAMVVLGCGAAVVMAGCRRVPGLATSAWLGIVPLALTANLLFPIGTIKAERLLYLPSLGGCLLVAMLSARALRDRRRAYNALLLIVVMSFAGRTWARNYDWQDNLALFKATVATSPGSAKAHYNAAVALQQHRRLDEALAHYRRALEIYPKYAGAALGIGRVYALRGDDDRALSWYEEALRSDWRLADVHLEIGLIHEKQRAYTRAEAAFREGLANDPRNPVLRVNLSAVRLAQGDRWEALSLLDDLDHLPATSLAEFETVAQARREIEEAAQ